MVDVEDIIMSGGIVDRGPIILQSYEGRLRVAASKGQNEEVKELLREGATFEPDREGRTALHYSAQNGHLETCRIILHHGCNTDTPDALGFTPLHRCVAQGHLEITELLLNEGCMTDVQDQHGNTPLHEAAWNGYSKSLELLVKHNCNVHLPNKAGFTALHLASQAGHNESSRVLLYAGCNPDAKNNYGDTALHTAARYGHAGVTRILISARCRLHEQNKNGDTALHITAALRRRKIAKLLVEAHIDVNVQNKQNETAVDVARRKEHSEIILIITSFSRPKTPRHGSREREIPPAAQVAFKDEIDIIDGPVVVPEDQPPFKSEKNEEKKRFFFFKKKKKDKDKEKEKGKQFPAGVERPTYQSDSKSKVEGFFSQYVPKQGVQYYRDLAGNIKQGPIGYSPACNCGPTIKKIEHDFQKTTGNIYEHIDASHQILRERIDHLDQRTSQQVYAIDQLTRERLDQERKACENRITERIEEEWNGNRNVLSQYNSQIQTWLDDKMASYGHCLDHHHDDSALPSRNILFDFHNTANGRLFKSRSDETLSDCSGKNRKRDFYESRQAAMRQIRGWSVPSRGDGTQKEKNNNHVTQAQIHQPSKNIMDRKADGASPKYEENQNTVYRDFNHPGGVRHDGAIPKQNPNHKQWQRPADNCDRPNTIRPRQSSPFESHLYRSVSRNQSESPHRHSNLGEGGVPNQNSIPTGARDSSLGPVTSGISIHNTSSCVSKHYDQNRNYQTSAYSSRPLTPNYRLAKSSDLLHEEEDVYSLGMQRSKSMERTIDNPDSSNLNKSPNRKSVTFLDRVTNNKTPTPVDNDFRLGNGNSSNSGQYRRLETFKPDIPYSSVSEVRRQMSNVDIGNRIDSRPIPPKPEIKPLTLDSRRPVENQRPVENHRIFENYRPFESHRSVENKRSIETHIPLVDMKSYNQKTDAQRQNNIYSSVKPLANPPAYRSEPYIKSPAINTLDYSKQSNNRDMVLNGIKSPAHTPSSFIPFDHSSPGQVVYNPSYTNKEDSTCSSNPDSGYSSKGLGQGHQSVSCTPSSSFSADRSLSIGTPSNSNSPCLPTNPIDFPKLNSTQAVGSIHQNTALYQRRLLEAAEKMRKTNQYDDETTADESAYNKLYVSLNYDPVHGSDV